MGSLFLRNTLGLSLHLCLLRPEKTALHHIFPSGTIPLQPVR